MLSVTSYIGTDYIHIGRVFNADIKLFLFYFTNFHYLKVKSFYILYYIYIFYKEKLYSYLKELMQTKNFLFYFINFPSLFEG